MRLRDDLRGATWRLLGSRLYLLAVASVLVAIGTSVALTRLGDPLPDPRLAAFLVSRVADALDDEAARAREARRLLDDAADHLSVFDDHGAVVVSNVDPPLPAPTADERARLAAGEVVRRGEEKTFVTMLTSPTGRRAAAVLQLRRHGGARIDPAVLVVGVLLALALVAAVAALLLAKPIAELGRATRAFGQGDLQARADAKKAGVFADLARAFNDMAERTTASITAEKELLANVSHELRTPLSRIRVALDLLDVHGAPEDLAGIAGDLGELERLVDDVLTAAKLDPRLRPGAGAPPLRVQDASPAAIVERAAQNFRAKWPAHALDVSVEGAPSTAMLDPALVRRALDNLLDNAGKYSERGARVGLAARIEDATLVFEVRDEGVGISREDQQRLFTPFFRAEKSRARATGGTGLGLVLARRIVEAHGGALTVASAPGQGTTARVALPLG